MQQIALSIAQRACPSIAYRIYREILQEDCSSSNLQELQEKLLQEAEILRIFSLKKEDGWLGGTFHGMDEPECCIRYLMEKGIEPGHHIIQEALEALLCRGDKFDAGSMERVGKPLDDKHLGGSKLIRACVFAYTGREQDEFITEQISEALEVFQYVGRLGSVTEIYKEYKNKLVFRDGVMWPSIYHLRLLAYTKSWRCPENLAMLAAAFIKLVEFSPIPEIKLLHRSQIISPASVFMNRFNENLEALSAREWMMWFHRTELIARLGISDRIPSINSQIEYVNHLLELNGGFFTMNLRHYYFTKWTQYLGLALEDDWRSANRMINDLTFRCLLINSFRRNQHGIYKSN